MITGQDEDGSSECELEKNIARFSVSELPIFFAASLKGHQPAPRADLRNVTENYDLALLPPL